MISLLLIVFILQVVIHLVNSVGATALNELVNELSPTNPSALVLIHCSYGSSTISFQRLPRRRSRTARA